MDLHTFLTCLVAVSLLTLTPGVDTMLIIRNSGRGGWWDGATSSLGICSGLFVHATLSALGISIILLQTAWAFSTLKYLGAAYLIWLGICSLKRAWNSSGTIFAVDSRKAGPQSSVNLARSFREGFLSNVLNPKTIVFYMAFLPQFIDPVGSALLQSLLVALIHFCVAMLYQCSVAAMVDRARDWLQSTRVNRIFNALTGTVLMIIGLRLVVEK
jgi:RhtB (resistance to homoserine/threonine) family protein